MVMAAAARDCPECKYDSAMYLAYVSENSFFRYYGCPCCGHVWGVHKDYTHVIFHVTPLPKKPDASTER